MEKFQSNEDTMLAQGEFFKYDFENDELPGKEYIDSLDEVSIFTDKVKSRIVQLGYTGNLEDNNEVVSYIYAKVKEAKVDISRQNIVNWFGNGMPSSGEGGRENVYKLCFALHMNEEETMEFFLKAYLERPFNYKKLNEAVYFFCLKNKLHYTDAVRIIAEINGITPEDNPNADDVTEQIGDRISEISNEDILIQYLTENRSGFVTQNKTATEYIQSKLELCMKRVGANSIDELLSVIYGYAARATEGYKQKREKLVSKPVYKESISKSRFPRLIKRNFPQRQQMEDIIKWKASYEVIRKALIMLNFYDFFTSKQTSDKKNKEDNENREEIVFDEFVDEINENLYKCGYVQMYWRNPYDWMIGYCASAIDPIRELQNLIYEYYLSDDSVYSS